MISYAKKYTETNMGTNFETEQHNSEISFHQSAGTANPSDFPQKLENELLDSDTSSDYLLKMIVEQKLADDVKTLISIGKREIFEDGMESDFSRHLDLILTKYSVMAMETIAEGISQQKFSPSVTAQILKLFGEYNDSIIRGWIYPTLILGLNSSSVDVRDGATVAIESLDDPKFIPPLERAIKREQNIELRQDMEEVLKQLVDTRKGN